MTHRTLIGILVMTALILLPCIAMAATFDIDSEDFTLYGNASHLEDDIIQLTAGRVNQKGAAWFNELINVYDTTLSFDYYIGSGTSLPAAGFAVALGSEPGLFGVMENHYAIEFDTFYTGNNTWDYRKGKHIALIKDTIKNHLIYKTTEFLENGTWHHCTIIIKNGSITVVVDDITMFTYDEFNVSENRFIGFYANTGYYDSSQHLIKNITINGAPACTASHNIKVLNGATGLPVEGAVISLDGKNYTTNANGLASITLIKPFANAVTVSHDGYTSYSDTNVAFSAGEIKVIELDMVESTNGNAYINFDIFENPPSAETQFEEPKAECDGDTISMFPMPIELDLKFFDKAEIKYEVDPDEQRIHVAIGKLDTKAGEKAYTVFKDIYQAVSDKLFNNAYNRISQNNTATDQKLGFPITAYVGGYADFSYNGNDVKLVEGGIVVMIKIENLIPEGFNNVFLPPPVSFLFLSFDLGMEANGRIFLRDSGGEEVQLSLEAVIEAAVEIAVSINAGAPDVASAGIGLSGKLTLGVKLPWEAIQKSFWADFEGSVYFIAKVLNHELKIPLLSGKARIYPLESNSPALVYSLNEVYDLKQYGLMERSPKAEEQITVDTPQYAQAELFNSAAPDTQELEYVFAPDYIYARTNVFPNSSPILSELEDGRLLLIWVDDDALRTDANRSALMYSICNGGVWSAAQQVYNDGTADFCPSVAVVGSTAHLIWQNALRPLTDADSAGDTLEQIDIFYTVFNGTDFETPVNLSNNQGVYNTALRIAASDNQIAAFWVENSENVPYLQEGTNTIRHTTKSTAATSWNAPVTLRNTAEAVSNLAAAYVNDELVYAYGEAISATQTKLYTQKGSGSIQVLQESQSVHSLQFSNGALYWGSDEAVYCSTDFTSASVVLAYALHPHFKLFDNGAQRAIVLQVMDGFNINLYAIYENDGVWTDPAPLTNISGIFECQSGYLTDNGNLMLAYQYTEVPDDFPDSGYGDTSVFVSDFDTACKITVDSDLLFWYPDVKAGEALGMTLNVTNLGTATSPLLRVTLYDQANTVLAVYNHSTPIGIGETVRMDVGYTLPDPLTSKTIRAVVTTQDGSAIAFINNTATAVLGYGDLAVTESAVARVEGGAKVTVTVRNDGFTPISGNSVTAYVQDYQTQSGQTHNITALAPGESATLSFTFDDSYLMANNPYHYVEIVVHAQSTTAEPLTTNNTALCLLAPVFPDVFFLSDETVTLAVGQTKDLGYNYQPIFIKNISVLWTSDSLEIATVDRGRITAVGEGTTVIRATLETGDIQAMCTVTVSGSVPNGDANDDGTVDIMDLVVIVDYIVNGNAPASMAGADANGDGTVDIMDLVFIIDLIVNPPVNSAQMEAPQGNTVSIEVPFQSSVPITALELTYTLSPGLTFVNAECSGMVGAGGDTNAVFANVNGGVTSGTVTLEVALQNGVTANQSVTVTAVTGANTVGTHSVGTPQTYGINVNASAIAILTQPVDATVSVGNVATFTMEATGPEPLTYQWYVNTNTGIGWLAIADATESVYTTGAAVIGDNGFRYLCRVSAGESYLDSAVATLTVVASPTTGDASHPVWLLAVALLAAAGLFIVLYRNQEYSRKSG